MAQLLISALKAIGLWSFISFVVACLGATTSYILGSESDARLLFESYVFKFNGVLIVGFGYGLAYFVMHRGKGITPMILSVAPLSDGAALQVIRNQQHAFSFIRLNMFAIPILIVGGTTLWLAGYPYSGFPKYFLAATSISLYYVGGMLVGYAYYTVKTFTLIEDEVSHCSPTARPSDIEVDAIQDYIVIASTLGAFAFYLAFRGTLTANFSIFEGGQAVYRKFLVLPILIFPWIPIVVGLYPRTVLKRIQRRVVAGRIFQIEQRVANLDLQSLSIKDYTDIEKNLMEIKEKLERELSHISTLSIKDSPSIFVAAISCLQYVVRNDSVVIEFIKSI